MQTENKKSSLKFLQDISNTIVLILAFLMPVFFLPTSTEFYEFNKLALLAVSTVILLIVWVIRVVADGKIRLIRSPIDLPILAIVVVTILGSIFSIDKTSSIYGAQGRWFPSLIGISLIAIFYYVVAPQLSNIAFIKNTLVSLVLGITVNTAVTLLSYFGTYVGNAPYFKAMSFSLTGSITTSVILAALASLIAGLLLVESSNIAKNVFLSSVVIINFFLIAQINILPGWFIISVGLVGSLLYTNVKKQLSTKKPQALALAGALLALIIINVLPSTKALLKNKDYPVEIKSSIRESWVVSSATVQEYPLLATGPSTYGLNFTRYRPLMMNNSDLWELRFDKPANELFNVLGTTGLIGATVVAIALVKILRLINNAKEARENDLIGILSVATLASLSVFFVTYATVLNTFVMVLLLSMLVATHTLVKTTKGQINFVMFSFTNISAINSLSGAKAIDDNYLHYILMAPVVAMAIYGSFIYSKFYIAEYYMRQSFVALQNGDATRAYNLQTSALKLSPKRDTYYTTYARTNLAIANSIVSSENLTEEQKTTVQQLIAQAIRSVRTVTETINPANVANWETRAEVYRNIIGVADNASEWSIGAYNTAIQLDPTNPTLRLALGGLYYSAEDYLSAANLFRQATTLKGDYANAHYNFAQALIKLDDNQNAKRELEITRSLLQEGTEDFKKVEQEIASLPQDPQVAGASDDKLTVEEIEKSGSDQTSTTQKPLTNVGEEPVKETTQSAE